MSSAAIIEQEAEQPVSTTGSPASSRTVWWGALLVLSMALVSDFRFRNRSVTESTSGRPDIIVLLEVAVYGLVMLWVLRTLLRQRTRAQATPLLLCANAFAGVYAVTAVWSPYFSLAVVRAAQMVVICAAAYTLATFAGRRTLHHVLHGYVLIVLAGVVMGIAAPVSSNGTQRFTWLAVHPVVSGTYLGAAIIAAVAYLASGELRRYGPGWHPVTYAGIVVVLGSGLVLNRTRGALVAALVGLVIVLVAGARKRYRLDVVVGVAVVAVVGVLAAGATLLAYLERGEGAQNLTTLNYRTTLWGYAIDAWSEQPLAGLGLGATRGVFLEETGLGGGHNAFINVLVDGGIITAGLWTGLIIALFISLTRLRLVVGSAESAMLVGILAFLVINSLTFEGLGASANGAMVLLFILVAWSQAARRTTRAPAGTTRPVLVPG